MKFEQPRCRHCGGLIKWSKNSNNKWVPIHLDDEFKICKPKVKIYSKEEIAKMNEELKRDQKDKS